MTVDKQNRLFPWWQTGYFIIDDDNFALNTRFYLRAKQSAAFNYSDGRKQLFVNNQPWPVYVSEIRFFLVHGAAGGTEDPDRDALTAVAVRMRSTTYGDLLADFVHVSALGFASPLRSSYDAPTTYGKMTLPAKYRLEAERSLTMNVRAPANTGITGFQAAVRGFDPYNEIPVIRSADAVDITAGDPEQPVALVSDRDKNIRPIDVEDLTFSYQAVDGAGGTGGFYHTEVTLTPPDGPKWTDDPSTPIGLLLDQPTSEFSITHTPPAPYIIMPGEQFFIDCLVIKDNTIPAQGRGFFGAMLKGYQEVPHDYNR